MTNGDGKKKYEFQQTREGHN
ncbi:Protein CBG27097 [Caenorhabditis briggsae]|uniref:Protein CBG27097 n=1 Tax=Caenorhabditis briggsae TaxID=6238 RepID=B6IHH3_CAEBR|nr:Protein CBG27097 [Caenorhabditis briggsae]CAR99353.1 Protein CBG27097 [Caenorhabditis briggsae]